MERSFKESVLIPKSDFESLVSSKKRKKEPMKQPSKKLKKEPRKRKSKKKERKPSAEKLAYFKFLQDYATPQPIIKDKKEPKIEENALNPKKISTIFRGYFAPKDQYKIRRILEFFEKNPSKLKVNLEDYSLTLYGTHYENSNLLEILSYLIGSGYSTSYKTADEYNIPAETGRLLLTLQEVLGTNSDIINYIIVNKKRAKKAVNLFMENEREEIGDESMYETPYTAMRKSFVDRQYTTEEEEEEEEEEEKKKLVFHDNNDDDSDQTITNDNKDDEDKINLGSLFSDNTSDEVENFAQSTVADQLSSGKKKKRKRKAPDRYSPSQYN